MKAFNINHIAEIKLTYASKVAAKDRPKIANSSDAARILNEIWDQNIIELQEQFIMLILNRGHRVLGRIVLSNGSTNGTIVDTKYITVTIARTNASAIILAHNHPSGQLKPSECDIRLTKKIKEICRLLDTTLLDHIIVTPYDGFYSFADEGLL